MVTERLNVLLRMDAGQYKREAREASTATSQVTGSANNANTATGKISKSMSGVATTAKFAIAGVATAAVGKFAKDSIAAASNLEESINAVNVVFGDAAEGVNEIGERAADSFGLSQRAFGEFAVRFSAFAEQIAERDGRSVVEIVDTMSTRVSDFASVHNLSLERAAEVAQSTLAGETEVFRRFGGDVSAAAVEAKILEEGIVDAGEAISEQDKILGRYMLFMEQTADTAGDFKNTQDDFANATRIAQANLEDFQATIGTATLPVLGEMVALGNDLITVLDGIAEAIPGSEAGIGEIFTALWRNAPILRDAIKLLEGLSEVFGDNSVESRNFRIEMEQQHKAAMGVRKSTWDASEAMYEVRDAAMAARPEVHGLADASERGADKQDDLEVATSNATTALEAQFNLLRAQTDPLFALQDATSRVAEAQQAIADAETPEEQREATQDLAEAYLDLRGAQIDAVEAGGQTREEFIKQQTELGMTRDQAEDLAEWFSELEGFNFTPKEISLSTRVSGPGAPTIGSFFGAANMGRQHGGPMSANHPYMVGEGGREMVIPNQDSFVVNNRDTERLIAAMSGMGGTTFNIPVQGTGNHHVDAQRQGHTASILRRMETLG